MFLGFGVPLFLFLKIKHKHGGGGYQIGLLGQSVTCCLRRSVQILDESWEAMKLNRSFQIESYSKPGVKLVP